MSHVAIQPARETDERAGPRVPVPAPRWFALGLLVLGGLLVVNTLLGPLVAGVLSYPFSETVVNETLGLEAVSLLLVAPLCLASGILALHGRPLGAVLALGPTGYSAYMFVQYVAGPGYLTYAPNLLLHVGMFSLASALLVRAWSLAAAAPLPATTRRSDRRWAGVLLGMAVFVLSRWAEAIAGMAESTPLPEAYLQDAGMYWSIFLLDLGIVVPCLVAAGVALWRGHAWARPALYALVGWFALVPPSVTAMALTKVVNGDPYANPADTLVLGVATIVFAAVAAVLYRPLFRSGDAGAP